MTAISDSQATSYRVVNTVFLQTFLKNAESRCPYFAPCQPASLSKNRGTLTCHWRRIENLTAATTALAEVTANASFMMGRTAATLSYTNPTATAAKYGNFVVLNEEVDVTKFDGETDKIMEVLGINAGETLDKKQGGFMEDNANLIYAGNVASDGAVVSAITLNAIKQAVVTLDINKAVAMSPMAAASGSQAGAGGSTYDVTSNGLMPSYMGICHPDVAVDISGLGSFIAAERYAGNVPLHLGEFGAITVAGRTVRFCSTQDASIDADSGGTKGSTGLQGTSDVDLYTTVITGEEAFGSVGLSASYGQSSYMAGDYPSTVEMIVHGMGSAGTSDPYSEISTIAWKAWWSAAELNANWARGIRSGATDLTA